MSEGLNDGRFARLDSDAVLTGDKIRGRDVVECFVCTRDGVGDVHRRHDSAVVVDSANGRKRVIDIKAAEEQRTATAGKRPVLRLPSSRVGRPASDTFHDRIMKGISAMTVEAWRGGSRVEERVVDTLERLASGGYDIWVIGGLVRDAVREDLMGVPVEAGGGDLDLVGSLPPGRFADGVRELAGRAELPIRFNPFSGVVALSRDSTSRDRLLEYACLKGPACAADDSLTFGCDLEADAGWRDLTINTLAYDWCSELLVDPTGEGLADLKTLTLRPPATPKSRRGFRAHLLFRYLKFVRRWPDASTHAVGQVIRDEFTQFRDDVRMLEDRTLEGLLRPFGASRSAQIETVRALGAKIAADCDWNELFADTTEEET